MTTTSGNNSFEMTVTATGGVLLEKLFLKISQNSQENTCARLFFNKVAGLKAATLLKKRLWYRCFPVNFARFLQTPFFKKNHRLTASEMTPSIMKIMAILTGNTISVFRKPLLPLHKK